MATTLTGGFNDIIAEVKENYPTGTFAETTNREAPYRASLKKVDMKLSEGVGKFPLRLNPSWNVGIIDDDAAFPVAKDPQRIQAFLKPEIFAGSFKIGFKTKAAAKSGKSTFSEGGVLPDRIESTAQDVAKYTNIVYAGSNRGRLATVESDGTSLFVASKAAPGGTGVQLLHEYMSLEAYDALSGGGLRDSFSGHMITTIDYDTRSVAYIKTSTQGADDRALVAGDHIFVAGTYGRTPYTLPDIVDDGGNADTIFGVSTMRTTYPKTKATVMGNGGALRNLSEQLILDAIDRPRQKAGKKITRILSNTGQGRKYAEFVAQDRRWAGAQGGKDPNYTLGYTEGSFSIVSPGVNCKLEFDVDIPPRQMYFLAWDTFFLYEAQQLDWADEDTMLKLTPTDGGHKSSYLAYICSIENQGCYMPLACTRLEDLKDPLFQDA